MSTDINIVLISPCESPINHYPKAGIEVIINLLASNLKQRGYRVMVVASSDSSADYELVFSTPEQIVDVVRDLLNQLPSNTVICDHSGYDLKDLLHDPRLSRVFHIEPQYVSPQTPSVKTAFVSNYLRSLYALRANPLFHSCPVIENGIEYLPALPTRHTPARNAVVYIGRISMFKGVGLAIKACEKTSVDLHIYGGLGLDQPVDYVYNNLNFLNSLLEKSRYCSYKGPIESALKKAQVLQSARCVVIPSIEPESCSLVALEAASAGVPVVTFDRGGTREYLGTTCTYAAYHKENESESVNHLANALSQTIAAASGTYTPYLSSKFTASAMTDRYVRWWSTYLKA